MKKILKKIVAIVCAMTLCVGLIPTTASAVDSYTGKLSIAGAIATSADSTAFYMEGTDNYKTGSDDWPELTMMPNTNDSESGIFVDGVRINDYFNGNNASCVRLRKISDSGKDYYIERVPNVKAGSVVTIKGTFYVYGNWMETDQFDSTPIVFEDSSFLWNGTQWVDCYSGKLTVKNALAISNNSTSLYMEGTDEYKTGSDDWPELTMMPNTNDSESGVFVDGVRINDYFNANNPSNVRLRKFSDSGKDYYIERIPNVTTGSVVTIKGTFYVYGNWMETDQFDSTPIVFEDSSFLWNGTQWVDCYSGKLTVENALAISNNSTSLYMEGTDEYKTGSDDWPELTMMPNTNDSESGIFVDGVRINDYFNGNNPSCVRLRKISDSGNDYYIERIPNVTTGSVVTIKGTFYVYGNWMETDQFDSAPITFEESMFQWNGSQWVDYVPVVEYFGKLTIKGAATEDNTSPTSFYIKGTDDYATKSGDNWAESTMVPNADDINSGIFVDGVRINEYFNANSDSSVRLRKYNDANCYYYIQNIPNIETGSIVTIKGTFYTYGNWMETDQFDSAPITFEESKFEWNGSKWVDYVELATYNGKLTIEGAQIPTDNMGHIYLKGTDAYLSGKTAEDWDSNEAKLQARTTDANSGIFVNGVKKSEGLLKKYSGVNNWYFAEGFSATATGDVVTIKGTFYSQDGLSKIIFEESMFQWSGTQWIAYVESSDYTATEFTVSGLHYAGIVFDEASAQWKMYYTLSNSIPGEANDTYYPSMVYVVDGTEYITHLTKATYIVDGITYDSLCMNIPGKVLPQILAEDTEYTITLKAGAAQGHSHSAGTACEDGIKLKEDFSFAVGTSHESSAPAIDYVTGGGGTANGIYLSSTDSFPITGWDSQLKKVGDNSGIYKYDSSTETYVATDVFIKKYADNKYYVCLSDVGESAVEGTIVMLKGTFTFAGLYEVTFKTAKYIYSGGAWKTYTATMDSEEDVEWYGDATGDATAAEEINSIDLVRILRYLAQEEEEIKVANVDLNSSGNIDEHDERMMRWLLVNGTTYFVNGSNIKGTPSYADDSEMRLAAYIGPTLEDGFALYKEAGFTTLIGENRAIYGDDGLDAYMKAAKEAGLDVLVQSTAIQDMLAGTLAVDASNIQTIYNSLSDTYGDTFRGLYMLDEPSYSQLGSHTNVLDVLNSLNVEQDKEFFTSFLPTYTNDDTVLWNDTSLSTDEKYAKYADAYGKLFGEFVYDFYPFQHKISGRWFWQTEDDCVRQDWFKNLEISAQAGHGKYKTGITVQSHASGALESQENEYYRDVTEADISFQAYSALAYGMKSIQYFTYDEHWDPSVGTTNSMIYNGETTAIYDAVKAVNTEIKAIDHILLNYNWQGTIGISVDDEDNIMDSVSTYASPRISSYSAGNDAIIGCLKDVNGYDGFMLVHVTDPAENKGNIDMSVTFNNATHAKVYNGGVESTVELTNGTYSVKLSPGQGVFVIPYIAE